MYRIALAACPHCKRNSDIYLSRAQSVWEKMAILLLLRPVRCHRCTQRHYRPIFVATRTAQSTGATAQWDKHRSA
jgi:hypothetical protein